MQYFNTGAVLSQQLADMSGKLSIDAKSLEILKQVTQKASAGDNEVAAQLLGSLPFDVKNQAVVMLLLILLSSSLALLIASLLLEEFDCRYPNDTCVLCS